MRPRQETSHAIATLYSFIEQFTKRNGFAPTNREMTPVVGGSVGRAQYLIETMIKRGHIRIIPNESRNVRLVNAPEIPDDVRAMRFDLTPTSIPSAKKQLKGRRVNDSDKRIGLNVPQVKGWKTVQDIRGVAIDISVGDDGQPRFNLTKGGKCRIVVMREREIGQLE